LKELPASAIEKGVEISYIEFMDAVTNRAQGRDILIEATIKFSPASVLKEIYGVKRKTVKRDGVLYIARKDGKEMEENFHLEVVIPQQHEAIILSHPKIKQQSQ
jgi:hypothetical protein